MNLLTLTVFPKRVNPCHLDVEGSPVPRGRRRWGQGTLEATVALQIAALVAVGIVVLIRVVVASYDRPSNPSDR